jgi:hypothetical protein
MWISDSSADFVIPEIESIVGEDGFKEIDGVIYAPVRKIAEELGYTVEWIGETQSVIVSKDVVSFSMTIDSDIYGYNKAIVKYEKPLLIESKTYYNLAKAYAGECQAKTRYEFIEYGARKEGYGAMAEVIDKIVYNEFTILLLSS